MTRLAIWLAFWGSAIGIPLHWCLITARERRQLFRVIDSVAISVCVVIVIGLWPLVWGDAP